MPGGTGRVVVRVDDAQILTDVELVCEVLREETSTWRILVPLPPQATLEKLQLQDERSELKEHLNTVVATTDLPADERSEAVDQMQKLSEIAKKEEMLETLIKAMDYEDAFVRADGTTVKIIVKSKKESSKSEANAIIQMVKKEIGETNFVAVEFQPTK